MNVQSERRSVKTITYESLHNIVRLINGLSALLLTILPGKAKILEGIQGWELRPTVRGPRFPRWMKNGVSSFNKFVHELPTDSDDDNDTLNNDPIINEEDKGIHSGSPLYHRRPLQVRTSKKQMRNNASSGIIALMYSWVQIPFKLLVTIPLFIFHILYDRKMTTRTHKASSSSCSTPTPKGHASRDQVIHRATDKRRGIIEDLHLSIEIFIENIFEFFHKFARFLFSPAEVLKALQKWVSSSEEINPIAVSNNTTVTASTLGESDPSIKERETTTQGALNTDARTCRDVITELGYPYEAIRVVTSDGYVLLLERIPRRDSQKVVYLQHGVLDSSMGWVSNGVVGSPAFAAYDQGFDVFLGNFRGLVSREHVNKKISSHKYWRYSINEHGTEDIPAMIEKINEIKSRELLNIKHDNYNNGMNGVQPYKLCAISHSLGGAAMIMYTVTQRLKKKPHRLSRLILLSPAGFHADSNLVFTTVEYLFLLAAPILSKFIPAFYIPTRFFRMLLNKLARDFHNYPAVGGLVQTLMSYVVGGDSSNWVGVLGLPHYNMNDMPGISFFVAHHLAQMKHAKKFIMYDYGNESKNMEIYGSAKPLDLGNYYRHINIPVDLVAGKKDNVIRPSMVLKHYNLMKDGGVKVLYNEFEYAHLDFTFSHREELLAYVMSRTSLVDCDQIKSN
ncbi:Lipase lipl-1 [Linum perenne]